MVLYAVVHRRFASCQRAGIALRSACATLWFMHCASCHGVSLEGQGSLPLSGATFRARWADDHHSVDDLFYIIRTLMPYGQPATLSKQEYIDIIAYILMVNGYPAGTQPLPSDPQILKRITIKTQHP